MEEAEHLSFLISHFPKYFPEISMATAPPKPYVSCIKIHGVPILPPLLDEECRREMRALREKAVAVERRLLLGCRRGDSGVASTLVSGQSQSTSLLLEGSHYLSAVGSADDSALSIYTMPGDCSPRNSIEQRLSFYVAKHDEAKRTESFLSNTEPGSVCEENPQCLLTGEASEKSPNSSTLTSSTDLNPYLNVTEDIGVESPTPESRRQDIGDAGEMATLCTSFTLEPLEHDGNRVRRSLTFENNPDHGHAPLSPNVLPGSPRSVTSLTDADKLSPPEKGEKFVTLKERPLDLDSPRRVLSRPIAPSLDLKVQNSSSVAAGSIFTSTPHNNTKDTEQGMTPHTQHKGSQSPSSSPPASRSSSSTHAFSLVPPDIHLRPFTTINDWLLSSSRPPSTVRSDSDIHQEHSPEESIKNHARAASDGGSSEVYSKNYNNPESGLDLEPSKLVVVRESSVTNEATVIVPQKCHENFKPELDAKTNNSSVMKESQDVDKQDKQWLSVDEAASLKSLLLTDKSDQSTDNPPAMLRDEAIPRLIRQHSFTVQTGPSNLLRSYVEENGMELNTGTFQNPKPTEAVAMYNTSMSSEVVDKSSRCGAGRKEWDLNRAKPTWVSGNKMQPFVKPNTPASRLKRQVNAKHRTRSVPSVYSTSSLPNSALNSPEKTQLGYGSIDGLNYKFDSWQKRPRKNLHLTVSSPKSATKFTDHLHTNRLGLSSQVQRRGLPLTAHVYKQPVTAHVYKQPGLKTCQSNPLPVDWDKTGSNPCPSNSFKKVPLLPVTKPNEATLPLKTIECPKESSNFTELLLHLKTEHNKQMALLLEKQRAEQEKIQEVFIIQQRKLMEEMQRSYPDAINSVTSLLATEPAQQTEEPQSTERESSQEENLVRPHETNNFLQENVCARTESLRKARCHNNNNSVSKENLASFLSVESLYESDGNKENVEQFQDEEQSDFEGLTIQSIPLNRSLPHLIISDSDLEILPYSNDFETSNIGDHLMRSPDSSSHIYKTISSLSEEIYNVDLDTKLSPKMYKTTINVPTTYNTDSTSQRNLQNSVNSNRSVESYKVHRSYETLIVHSSRESVSSRNKSGSLDLSSSLGRVRHSPRNSARSGQDNESGLVYSSSVQRTYDTLHPSICASPQLDFPLNRRPSTQEMLAASKIVAAAKGYLVRRLMKTEVVQNMITTIAETLKTAIELRDEILSVGSDNIPQADLDLRARLHNQLNSEHQSLRALFLHSTVAHRIAVIAADRERIKTQLLRPSSGQRPLTSATQRCLKRKQEPEPTPRGRPSSCLGSSRRPASCLGSSRRPLWETSSGRQRSCSGQPVPAWVVNPKPSQQPQARPPPARKPWR